jgi:uncharacterized membrane protein YkvA (DUF1232 family)
VTTTAELEAKFDHRRYFIVTATRSGSTLLSAIMADAGAAFGMATPEQWDRTGGDLEHPQMWRVLMSLSAAESISIGRPAFGLSRMRWVAHRSLAKRRLKAALAGADFAKVYGAHKLVRPAFKLGFFPTVILSYRRFEDQALSLGLMHAHASWESLRENYRSIYENGLLLLHTFGGCVVSYEDIVDPANRAWADRLAEVTHLPAEHLLAARDRRVQHPSRPTATAWEDPEMGRLFDALNLLRERVLPPCPQVLRSWVARSAAADRALARSAVPAAPSRLERAAAWLERPACLLVLAARDRRVPRRIKLAALLAIVYFFYPVDLISNSIPFSGRLDEMALLGLGLSLAKLFPREVLTDHACAVDALFRERAPPLSRLAKICAGVSPS